MSLLSTWVDAQTMKDYGRLFLMHRLVLCGRGVMAEDFLILNKRVLFIAKQQLVSILD